MASRWREADLDDCTEAEWRVLDLAAEGLRADEIAKKIFRSKRTVEKHLENVRKRKGLRGRVEIALAVWRHRKEVP